MGKAIIAPHMENIQDILSHQQEGLLYRPEDAGAFAQELRTLVDDPGLRFRLGLEARKKIEAERTWRQNAVEVIRLVENMARPGRYHEVPVRV